MELDPFLVEAVKRFEGFVPKAQWDYKQYTNGYGTKAAYAGEVIDRATAEARLQDELGGAYAHVDSFCPDAPQGVKNALASLTFNAGSAWMQGGLGNAIKDKNYALARALFVQYDHAGGSVNPGLHSRRLQEASWFDTRIPGPIPDRPPPIPAKPVPKRKRPPVAAPVAAGGLALLAYWLGAHPIVPILIVVGAVVGFILWTRKH